MEVVNTNVLVTVLVAVLAMTVGNVSRSAATEVTNAAIANTLVIVNFMM